MAPEPEITETFFLKVPATFLISGSTQSGKTSEVARICENWSRCTRNGQKLVEIYLFYETYQPDLYGRIEKSADKCHFKQGFPDDFSFLEDEKYDNQSVGRLLILDDLGYTLDRNSANLEKLFTVLSHHTGKFQKFKYSNTKTLLDISGTSVMLVVQDPFSSKPMKTIMKNAKYVVLTKSRFDLITLQKILFPAQKGILRDACEQCFYKMGRNSLLIDNSVDVSPSHRLKNLGIDEECGLIFKPR